VQLRLKSPRVEVRCAPVVASGFAFAIVLVFVFGPAVAPVAHVASVVLAVVVSVACRKIVFAAAQVPVKFAVVVRVVIVVFVAGDMFVALAARVVGFVGYDLKGRVRREE
jgi:hypothetical protein